MAVAEKDKYKVNNTALVDKDIASSYNIPLGVSANYSLDLDDLGYKNYNYTFVNYNSSNIWGNIANTVSEYKYQGSSIVFASKKSSPYPKENTTSFSLSNPTWWLPHFGASVILTKNTYFKGIKIYNAITKEITFQIQAGVINDDGTEADAFATYNTYGLFLLLQAGGGKVSPVSDITSNYYGGGGGAACIVYINLYKATPTTTSISRFRVNRLDTGEIDLDFKLYTSSSYSTQVKVMPGNTRYGGSVQIVNSSYCQLLKSFKGGDGTAPNNHGGDVTSNPDSDSYYLTYFNKSFKVCKEYRHDGTRYMTGIGTSGGLTYSSFTYGGAGGSLLSLIETDASLSYRGSTFLGGYGYGAAGRNSESTFYGAGSSVGYILTTYDN